VLMACAVQLFRGRLMWTHWWTIFLLLFRRPTKRWPPKRPASATACFRCAELPLVALCYRMFSFCCLVVAGPAQMNKDCLSLEEVLRHFPLRYFASYVVGSLFHVQTIP